MTITVLSPYQVFFIDESEKMWAVLKDGRARFIKSVPAFSCFSAEHKYICGVEFDGEQTTILATTFGFGSDETATLFSQWGYYYYPALLETKTPYLAVMKADLLNSAGTADMVIYKKTRKRYHPIYQVNAKIVPPVWGPKHKKLYYITSKGALARVDEQGGELLAQKASMFCLNAQETQMAYYDNDTIFVLSMETGSVQKAIAFDVTALSFDQTSNILFFATSKENAHNIYVYNQASKEVSLFIRASSKITAMTY